MRALALAVVVAAGGPQGCPGELPANPSEETSLLESSDGPTAGGTTAWEAIECGQTVEADTTWADSEIDAYECNIGAYDGPERVWSFAPATSGPATFRLVDPRPMEVDHDVVILDADGACVAWGSNSVDFDVDAGTTYRLVVDGYAGDRGPARAALECDLASVDPGADVSPEPGSCAEYESTEQENAPIQVAAAAPPASAVAMAWTLPTASTRWVDFSGEAGAPAEHEGIDYIHDDAAIAVVPVVAASDGVVVYVRSGCPESDRFDRNEDLRECGSGWGNHVVIEHGDGVYTRYAHLDPADLRVRVGDAVDRGEVIAGMGNSGRSETRHLHMELGTRAAPFDPCAPASSFDRVHPPGPLGLIP